MKSKKLIVPPRKFFHGGHYIISFFFIGWFCTYIKNTIKISIILGFFFLNFWGPWDPAPASSTPGPTDVMLLFIHVPFFFYLYVVLTMASHGYQWSLYTNNNNKKKKLWQILIGTICYIGDRTHTMTESAISFRDWFCQICHIFLRWIYPITE